MITKSCYIVIIVFILMSCKNNLLGTYENIDNHISKCKLDLNKDNTYLYICSGHLIGTHWSYGNWERKKDTLYFSKKYLYDTIRTSDKDSLIPSFDTESELIIKNNETTLFLHSIYMEAGNHPQKYYFIFPKSKLVIKGRKLFEIKNVQELDSDYYAK